MSYCTISEVLFCLNAEEQQEFFGGMTENDKNKLISNQIDKADILINALLSNIYQVPFSGFVDALIFRISLDLSVANLYEFKYRNGIIPEQIIKQKNDALNVLNILKSGQIQLSDLCPRKGLSVLSNKDDNSRYFSDEFFSRYKQTFQD